MRRRGVVARDEEDGEVRGGAAPGGVDRIAGLDVARAIAFGGMLLAHFTVSRRSDNPPVLSWLDNAANSWSGPLFCLVLGIGGGLLAAKGAPDSVFVRRGLALFVVGLVIWPHVHAVLLILPHLGLALAVIPLLRRLPDRGLLAATLIAFAVPAAVTAVVDDHGLRRATQPTDYGDLLAVPDVLGNILWSGGYPLAGWIGFVLIGVWMARRALDDDSMLRRLAIGGIVISLAQPLFDAGFRAFDGRTHDADAGGMAAFLDASAHSNRTAWFVLACATVVAVTAICLLLVRGRRTVARPLVLLGQLALTAYVAHIVLLQMFVRDWRTRSDPHLLVQFVAAAAVFVALAGLATAWRSRFSRGPLEAVVRLAGRSGTSRRSATAHPDPGT